MFKLNQKLNLPVTLKLINNLNKITELSLSDVDGRRLVVIDDDNSEPAYSNHPRLQVFKDINPGSEARVIAVDSSAIPMAYSERKWFLIASLGLITRDGKSSPPSIIRLGPYILGIERREDEDHQVATRSLREHLESSVIRDTIYEAELTKHTLLLVDGSLNGFAGMDCVVAAGHDITVLGISKTTKFVPSDPWAMPNKPTYSIMGSTECYHTVAARLSHGGVPLRIDATNLEGLSSLLSSDTILRGYPDTLRIAHYASLISTSEEAAAKAMLSVHGAFLDRSVDRRRMLLGVLKVRG